MLESMIVNSAGKKMVETGPVGSEKQRCTIMLAVTVDGQKLIPYVVFKQEMMTD
jgi:hypothetical protein